MARDWTRNRLKFFIAGPLFEAGDRFIPRHTHNRLAQLVADHHRAVPRQLTIRLGGTERGDPIMETPLQITLSPTRKRRFATHVGNSRKHPNHPYR
ncbi:methylase involved in ubiquinone/menaquinone biosynthesis [Mycobacteroides abscessus subsp. abscessus]|jgi:hypothetical protein|nr:hypothetical protein [Mycobacteroides abscessus]SIH70688.1 methylase involved in ubiquinone/menaquinone biosynthesis [Mycobacteroides abscessus subsp. abscessus]SIN49702.1 methylase involved in ubiquinone/menaquinone biosynthesis [Mycobacteroides abscessus subsp. bolletii]SLC59159.1 methylase involved in ubiquinone/menaquinone biosynthesis [Mycobacteroides abscessus subsp. massiliense]MBE5447935.1 hypothetical protein [Mycobacteroides abscessus]